MKRKTNLFYLDGPDSKFITFSNYTEALTGNFLSTNTKLFPSRFLCLNIKDLTNDNKESFVKLLVSYYESKLAVLRDNLTNDEYKKMSPLNYLFETLLKMSLHKKDDGKTEWILRDYIDLDNLNDTDIPFEIVYCNDITEQDFNGTYTDTICIVDLGNTISGKLKLNKFDDKSVISVVRPKYINNSDNTSEEQYCLYGWENGIINDYKNIYSKFDSLSTDKYYGEYNINSCIESILLENKLIDELAFNVVIPLCDLVDINYKTNFSSIENEEIIYHDENDNEIKQFGINLTDNNNLYEKNIPLGMWFSDNMIVLKKDSVTNFYQTWSLTISSQFKPFGYSKHMPTEINQSYNSNAFATFAQVLTKQNEMINSFSNILISLNEQKSKIIELTSKINNIDTKENIENINERINKLEIDFNNKLDNLRNEIIDMINNLKWQSAI